MAHPYSEHRSHKHQKSRVAHIAGKAAGGSAHSDVKEDKALIRKMVKGPALRADGGAVRQRSDKVARAKGGRVKGTTVNVIVSPSKPDMAGAPMMAAPPPPMPPKPPMMPPAAPAPMGAAPGLGGMPPIRSDGGRAYKRGGAVKHGKMSGEKKHGKKAKPFKMRADGGVAGRLSGEAEDRKEDVRSAMRAGANDLSNDPRKESASTYASRRRMRGDIGRATGGAISDSSEGGTQVQHSGNKSDSQNIGRGPVITRATGGPIYADGKKGHQMAWLKGVGAGGGKGRLKKAHHDNKAGHEPWLKDAAS